MTTPTYCPCCGERIAPNACTSCGASVQPHHRFCKGCGNPQSPEDTDQLPDTPTLDMPSNDAPTSANKSDTRSKAKSRPGPPKRVTTKVVFPHQQALWIEQQSENREMKEGLFLQGLFEFSAGYFDTIGAVDVTRGGPNEELEFKIRADVQQQLKQSAKLRGVVQSSILRGIIQMEMQKNEK